MALKINANKIELVPLKDIKLNPKNRNKHSPEQIAQFVKILRYQGNRNPGVISNRSGLLVAGEGRYLAMKEAGETHMPVMFQDFEDEEQEYLYGISDNAIASQAALDLAEIHVDLKDMGPFDLDLLGIKDFQFEPDPETQGDPDTVPEVPKVAKTKRGELWTLGAHRLLIDDCTVKENVERLMGGEKADMVFTDPPYNLGAEMDDGILSNIKKSHQHSKKLGRTDWDSGFDIAPTLERLKEICGGNSVVYVCTSHFLAGEIWESLKAWCDRIGWCIWYKPNPAPSLQNRHWTWACELIVYATKGKHVFNRAEGRHTPNLWEIQVERHDTGHVAQKPVAVSEKAITHSSNAGQSVADLFLGSGSTLIACEKTNRRCFGMEIEPLYGDVILSRFAKFSGKDPVREDGMRWSELNG